ncbi:glycosyltransferase family 4 protein [candidate division KSB1 bacterium]|nr:glycosyltransferase family 4 protein [candidate division KSB1 bacterium]NIR73468.1 glycosyltransferase family 4 protein [candidate division KSB1 bacterium]NIS27083.1 glycosyltransferase family 4 protein [candidate division KSB1 bacterium]NIT73927.1 glycosyltransferase family 4 protein [candidate division KSB1 bacterium]NIU27828.1 glycosyltransferase family 4 protein [candidate division KSB1 bacterium]
MNSNQSDALVCTVEARDDRRTSNLPCKCKIAYISDQQYPIEKADSEQVINNVSALAAAGSQVTLVIPRDWRNFGTPKHLRKQNLTDFYGVQRFCELKELVSFPITRLRLEKYSHCILAPLWGKLSGQDIVYTRNPLPAFLSLLLGLRVLFETYRNYEKHNSYLGKLLARCSGHCNLLGIITHSKLSKQSLVKFGIDEQKVTVIHNGTNPDLFNHSLTKQEARQRLCLPVDANIACYAGRLDKEKGIPSIIELAAMTPEITYFFIGKTQKDPEDWIENEAEAKRLRNIRRIPWLKSELLSQYLLASDVLLIPPTAEPLIRFGKTVLPLKLFLYMGAGRPILAPSLPDILDVLDSTSAVLVEPDDLDAASTAIRNLFSDNTWADELARTAKQDSENYTWPRRAERILAFIQERLTKTRAEALAY